MTKRQNRVFPILVHGGAQGDNQVSLVHYNYLNKKHCRIITRLVTRHCHLNKHLHTIGVVGSALCRKCGPLIYTFDSRIK